MAGWLAVSLAFVGANPHPPRAVHRFPPSVIHDGVNLHPSVTLSWRGQDFALMHVALEDVGLSWSYRF